MYLIYLSTFFLSYIIIQFLLETLSFNLFLVIGITQSLTILINIFSQFIYIFRKKVLDYFFNSKIDKLLIFLIS